MNAFDLPVHFLRPWWWLALAPLALWMLAKTHRGRGAFARLVDPILLPHLVHAAGASRRMALVPFALAWLLAVAALSGPAWQKIATPLYVNGAARVVALSLSDDMLAQDLKPDRLTRARFAVQDLLAAAGDARTALVAYAGAAFTVAPLTNDKRTVLNLLRALRPDVMPVPGNDAAAGIRKSVALLQQAKVRGGEIVVVADTAGAAAIAAARAAHAQGIRVDVLGIGTAQGAPVPRAGGGFASGGQGLLMVRRDDGALRAVAAAGGGQYVVMQADGSGAAAFAPPLAEAGGTSRSEHAQLWRDGGIWLLPILAILAALAFRRGWLLLVFAVVLLPVGMPVAHATTWQSLWSNRDQRALHALQRGDAAQARKLATTPGLRGAAAYRAGDYAAAAKAFAQGGDAQSRYNLGNALAKQGQYRKAIDAYRQALRQEPALADARANLDAVEAWLKKHAQRKPQQGRGSSQQPGQQGQSGQQSGDGAQPPSSTGTPPQQPSSSGASGSQAGGRSSAPTRKPSQGHGSNGTADKPASAAQAAQQQDQAKRAAQGLEQELHRDRGKTSNSTAHPFALGQTIPQADAKLDAQQRALLRAVPDDPGALLRRKFQLEWQQRHGGQTEDGQQ